MKPSLLACDLVDQLETLFPELALRRGVTFGKADRSRMGVLLDLLAELDAGIVTALPVGDQLPFRMAVADIRSAHRSWLAGGDEVLGPRPSIDGDRADPVTIVHSALSRCPDLSASASSHVLAFLGDAARSDLLRADLASVERLHAAREWKAATVLAGSVLEALLLERLRRVEPERVQAVLDQQASAGLPARALTERSLRELAALVRALGLDVPSRETLAEINKAGEFRNLIHPGLAERRFPARQSTATFTLAAVYRFIEEWERMAARGAGLGEAGGSPRIPSGERDGAVNQQPARS